MTAIAGDEVAFGCIATAITIGTDAIVGCGLFDADTTERVLDRRRAVDIGADVITRHYVAGGVGI